MTEQGNVAKEYRLMRTVFHKICQNCGKLKDIQFEDLTQTLKKQFGTDFLFYDLKVFYVCPDCQKKLGTDPNIHGYNNRMD